MVLPGAGEAQSRHSLSTYTRALSGAVSNNVSAPRRFMSVEPRALVTYEDGFQSWKVSLLQQRAKIAVFSTTISRVSLMWCAG